jgi:hypothetical protein
MRYRTANFGFYSIVRTDDGNTWLGGLGSIGCLTPKITYDEYEYTSFVPLSPINSAQKKG